MLLLLAIKPPATRQRGERGGVTDAQRTQGCRRNRGGQQLR
jgi:hypothetical protein